MGTVKQMSLFADLAAASAQELRAGPRVRNLTGSRLTPATLPPGSVYIGRRTRAGHVIWPDSDWRNHLDKCHGTREERVRLYECRLCASPDLMARLPEIAGLDLWCWCASLPCHGDVLLRLANRLGPL